MILESSVGRFVGVTFAAMHRTRPRPSLLLLLGIMGVSAVAFSAAPGPAPVWVEPVTGMSFIRVGKGCFHMGTKAAFRMSGQTLNEAGFKGDPSADERPVHQVCVSEFWIGRYEVRADEWEQVMKHLPPRGRGAEPASGVSWAEAVRFAEQLSTAGDGRSAYRLPTEAEWEMACLAGQRELVTGDTDGVSLLATTVFSGINKTRPVHPRPHPVGSRQANPWGLFDMRGNVAEWVLDSYATDGYKRHRLFDPVVHNASGQQVVRGGSYRSEVVHLRCASRGWYDDGDSLPSIGLRLVRKARP